MQKEVFTEYKAEQFLSKYLPVAKNQLVSSIKEIDFNKFKFPLVLKLISPNALHKSDVGGVKFVHTKEELNKEFNNLTQLAKDKRFRLEGILVQEYREGHFIIVGGKKDPTFGQVMLVGAGGIFTEVMEDISIRACPITIKDAEEMINELKYSKVLKGFRGKKVNMENLKHFLVKFSEVMTKHQNIIELDINPLIINEEIAEIIDARIVFQK
jgi:succinyl-CoA synthetase beta subunit